MKIYNINCNQNNLCKNSVKEKSIYPVSVPMDSDVFIKPPVFKASNFAYRFSSKYKPYRQVAKFFESNRLNYKSSHISFEEQKSQIINESSASWPEQFKASLAAALKTNSSQNRLFASDFVLTKYAGENSFENEFLKEEDFLEAAKYMLSTKGAGEVGSLVGKESFISLCKKLYAGNSETLHFSIQKFNDLKTYLETNPEIDTLPLLKKHINNNMPNKEIINYLIQDNDVNLYDVDVWEGFYFRDDYTSAQISCINYVVKNLCKNKDFDINKIKFSNGDNVLTKAYEHWRCLCDGLLQNFPNLDTNHCPPGEQHLIIRLLQDNSYVYKCIDLFKALYCHPRTDRSIVQTSFFEDALKEFGYNAKEFYKVIEDFADEDYKTKIETIYKREGTFTLSEMDRISKYKNFYKFANMTINNLGDRFGHALSDVWIDSTDTEKIQQLSEILSTFESAGYCFNATNDLGLTPLNKAIECQNEVVANLLRNYSYKI